MTNEWVGYNALSEIFRNDWLTPAPFIQPPEEDGDYVELYDAGTDTDGDDNDSNDVYEDTYEHDNGNDALDNHVGQANDVGEDQDDDGNDEAVDDKDNNHDDAPSWPRLFFSGLLTLSVFYNFKTICIFGLLAKFIAKWVKELHLHISKC